MRVLSGVVAIVAVLALVLAAVLVGPITVAGVASPASPQGAPVAPGAGTAGVGAAGVGDPYFPDAGNGGYDVAGYDIDLRYDPVTDRLEGRTVVTATATEDLIRFNLDLRLAATAVTVDGAAATISQRDGELEITPATPLTNGAPMVVAVDYAGVPSDLPPPPGDPIAPWTRTSDGAVAVGEPQSAAWWFPSNDHPQDKATVAVAVTVPAGVEVISGGELLAGPEPVPGGDRWSWRTAQPMTTYLAFVAIGQYVLDQRDTPYGPFLAAYAETLSPQVTAAARAAIDRSPQVIAVLEEVFGPYPFDQLGGVVPGRLGFALENQTRPVYSSVFFENGQGTEVVVHELAHQWFGDSVSVARWRDIWINEGFATYAEWLYDERTGGPSAQQRADSEYAAIPARDGFWRVPPGDPGPQAIFDPAVYVRGGMAVQAIRSALGDESFFAVLRAFTTERADGNASVEDFLALAERETGVDLDALAQEWLYDTDRPDLPPGG